MSAQNNQLLRQEQSASFFAEAGRYMPGGVNSPVRAFQAVGGAPIYIHKGEGAYLWDVDGNRFLDLLSSWGPLILGHRHPQVIEAIQQMLKLGTSFGAPTELETRMATLITEALPAVEMVRMVNSGTEATMSALRLARGYTGRDKIVKFEGCYHGHVDSLLIKAGSGLLTLGVPTSPGVPTDLAASTVVAPYNDLGNLKELFAAIGNEIAAVIVEPVAGNMGVVLPEPGFLTGLRELTKQYGALLIFDEVITGFRVTYGGAQTRFTIEPDLTCLGKIIGGGLPVGAYGGRREIMEWIAPVGPVYQAGTLSGNPLAMAAGIATLEVLKQSGFYEELEKKSAYLSQGLTEAAVRSGFSARVIEISGNDNNLNVKTFNLSKDNESASVCLTRIGSMLCTFFTSEPVTDYRSASTADTGQYSRYFWTMLQEGVYLAPAQFEAAFVSAAHTYNDLDRIIGAGERAFAAARG